MLKIITGAQQEALDIDRYYIQEEYDGKDLLCMSVSPKHPQARMLQEETVIEDTETGQRYLIKTIDEGTNSIEIKCLLDLDELRADLHPTYSNRSDTVAGTIEGVLPAGWTVVDHALITNRRTVELEGATPEDVIIACAEVYGVTCRYDTKSRQVHIWDPERLKATGVYITDELNLKALNYKGKSTDFATRLYAVGKDGLTFAAINDGKSYVEDHTYSDRVICTYWKDERYTVAENLLEDAKKKLAGMAVPQRSYECSVVDLARARELAEGEGQNIYAHLEINMYTVCTLMDRRRGTRVDHRVVRLKRWPAYPEKNEVTLSTVAPTIQAKVQQSYNAVTNPNSSFQRNLLSIVNSFVDGIAGYNGGNMLITKNADGKPNGIKFMDTEDEATAKKILWINLKGILYSSNGTAGLDDPNATVWSFEKNGFAANWLVAGTLDAALVRVVNLVADNVRSSRGDYLMNLWAAVLTMLDDKNLRARLYTTGTGAAASRGILQVFSGQVSDSGTLGAGGRIAQIQPTFLEVGHDGNGNYDGEIKCGTVNARVFYCKKFAPEGQNELTLDWVRVNKADGGTAWALCGQ